MRSVNANAPRTPPVARNHQPSTVYDTQVGYTCVASQLSPRQVITLLNELFSVFDELTQRNGVYKVRCAVCGVRQRP